jgi:hypothetical protein
VGLAVWAIATISYFALVSRGFAVSPIAEDGLMSLLSFYIPIVLVSVFLLLFLTRKRATVEWEDLFAVNRTTAKREAWMAVGYLLSTQVVLGLVFNQGLHFPGTDVYTTGSHNVGDVGLWMVIYTLVYVVIPILWLRQKGFSFRKLFASFQWLRDLWILVAYWVFDFFGPIFAGVTDFTQGMTANQYALGVPVGVLANTLGAGLPVVVMMHLILIPRVAVLVNNKFTVILLGGLFYAGFGLFDPGVDYSTLQTALTSFTFIVMTQTLVGMGKATFTVVTGNPFIHFVTLHVISARIPFDTGMYVEIFGIK